MSEFEEGLAAAIATSVKEFVAPLQAHIEQLERKVAELQTKGVEYKGTYQRACSYEIGSVVTMDGSMWACVQDVGPNAQPGQSQNWQLCCRAGRDARNGKD